jgi:hypothetical protein
MMSRNFASAIDASARASASSIAASSGVSATGHVEGLDARAPLLRELHRGHHHLLADLAELHWDEDACKRRLGHDLLSVDDVLEQAGAAHVPDDDVDPAPPRASGPP